MLSMDEEARAISGFWWGWITKRVLIAEVLSEQTSDWYKRVGANKTKQHKKAITQDEEGG